MERLDSDLLIQQELEVREDLESVLCHKELLWSKKERCDRLFLGDRNTIFFHRRTL